MLRKLAAGDSLYVVELVVDADAHLMPQHRVLRRRHDEQLLVFRRRHGSAVWWWFHDGVVVSVVVCQQNQDAQNTNAHGHKASQRTERRRSVVA